MKRQFSFLIFLVILAIITGCAVNKETEIINEMKSKVDGMYNVYIFFDLDDSPPVEPSQRKDDIERDVQSQMNIYDSMHKLGAENIASFVVKNKRNAYEYIEIFNIQEFPTFFILDTSGVVLRTTDVQEAENFLAK